MSRLRRLALLLLPVLVGCSGAGSGPAAPLSVTAHRTGPSAIHTVFLSPPDPGAAEQYSASDARAGCGGHLMARVRAGNQRPGLSPLHARRLCSASRSDSLLSGRHAE